MLRAQSTSLTVTAAMTSRPAASPDLLRQRYGSAPTSTEPTPADASHAVIDQLLAHRSVRGFLDKPLAGGTLELLVAAAQSASSSSNLQAWSVVAVEDAGRKARLSAIAGGQAHMRQAPLLLVWVADLSRLDRVAERRGDVADANRFTELFLVAAIDAALAAQNAVIAAESLGLGTVYIGALRNRVDQVAAELILPPRSFAVFGLCVGHPDPARPASIKPRLPQSAVLHRETYATLTEEQGVRDYDETMQAFQRTQAMPVQPWSQQASQRVRGAASLSGRHVLAQWLRERGLMLD